MSQLQNILDLLTWPTEYPCQRMEADLAEEVSEWAEIKIQEGGDTVDIAVWLQERIDVYTKILLDFSWHRISEEQWDAFISDFMDSDFLDRDNDSWL